MSDYSNQNSQNFSQSSAFAAALQRAKQIAAKIHPGGNQPVKRSIEDDSGPESKKFGGQSDYNNAHSPTGMSPAAMQAAAQAAAVAARLSQINNNSNSNAAAGGAQDPVQRARDLINKMVNQQGGGGHNGPMDNGNHGGAGGGGGRGGFGGGGPGNFNNQPFQEIMIPGSKVGLIIGKGGETIKQLQEKSGAKMVIIQDGPGQEMEKPLRISGDPQKVEHAKQLVFDLIQEKDNYNAQRQQQAPMNGTEQAEVFVPKSAVGVVIGKGGDMIKKIQGESGCKLQFIQGRGDGPGDRRCIVQGSRAQVEEGKRMIEELIESVQRREQGGGGRGGGRGGDRDDRGDRGDRPHRGGRDNHDNGNGGQYGGNDFSGPQVTREEYTFTVPVNKCGIIIGRGGDTIKQINQQSGAHTEMDRKASANQTNEKTFTVKGEPHQIEEAKRLIQDKINMEVNLVYVGSSTAPAQQYQNNGGQQQNAYGQSWGGYQQQSWDQSPQVQASAASAAAVQQPQPGGGGGQADYSQQWIEYYRQMGMHREAEMIEQQVKARQAATSQQGPAAAVAATVQTTQVVAASNAGAQQASGGGGGGGQADYSAEWAEYYRRLGRVDEAEAIEKQIAANKPGAPAAGGGGQPGGAAGQQFGGAGGAPGGAGGGNPQQMAAQQAAGGFNAQQFQQYYAGAAAAGGQPGGYQGYPYGGGYPGQQGGQPGQQGGQGPDKN